jgi:hypothetical protein
MGCRMALTAAAAATLLLTSCARPAPGDPALITADDPVGVCSVGEAFQQTVTGLASFSAATDNLPFVLTCLTPGATGTLVTILVPGLRGELAPAGIYRVQRATAGVPSGTAWVEVHLMAGSPAPAHYSAGAGTLHITSAEDGVVTGSYELALDRAPETDPRYPGRTAVRGAFRAPAYREGEVPR